MTRMWMTHRPYHTVLLSSPFFWNPKRNVNLRILVYLVIYDSGWVSLEHLLVSRHPSRYVRYGLYSKIALHAILNTNVTPV